MRNAIAIAIALTLSACAGQGTVSPAATGTQLASAAPAASQAHSDPIATIAAFTATDLQNADAIAVASGDAVGHACFPALSKFVQSIPTALPTTTVSGAISAFEAARTTRLKVRGTAAAGIPDYLKIGCSALVTDEIVLVNKLAIMAGGAAVLGPLAPGLGAAIGASLPIPIP